MPLSAIQNFLHRESSAGLILIAASIIALGLANSPAASLYSDFLQIRISIAIGSFEISKPALLWINDGLMAVFFFLIGLEVKREMYDGELSSLQKAALPVLAAIGGMAGPAAIYAAFNWQDPEALRGWAVPSATDIAFALGILGLLGPRVPISLRVFLAALAIIDDIGAIAIIAVFYSDQLSSIALIVATGCISVLAFLNWRNVRRTDVYVAVGIVLWIAVLKSGVHATLAGVITALAVPVKPDAAGVSPLTHFEEKLHPWIQFAILPLFAFANAGVSLSGLTSAHIKSPITLGVTLGLFVGKQAGVLVAATFARYVLGIGLPEGSSFRQFYGIAVITGVGFTMSLFIGELAFDAPAQISQMKIGVLLGSCLSGALAYVLLWKTASEGTDRPNTKLDTP